MSTSTRSCPKRSLVDMCLLLTPWRPVDRHLPRPRPFRYMADREADALDKLNQQGLTVSAEYAAVQQEVAAAEQRNQSPYFKLAGIGTTGGVAPPGVGPGSLLVAVAVAAAATVAAAGAAFVRAVAAVAATIAAAGCRPHIDVWWCWCWCGQERCCRVHPGSLCASARRGRVDHGAIRHDLPAQR
jgi:hypothetical protein